MLKDILKRLDKLESQKLGDPPDISNYVTASQLNAAPTGGTTEQVLVKSADSPMWVNVPEKEDAKDITYRDRNLQDVLDELTNTDKSYGIRNFSSLKQERKQVYMRNTY